MEDCEACGSCEFVPISFREHALCGFCIDRWKKLDSLMQCAEGRDATWEEMMKGLHPDIALEEGGGKPATMKVSSPLTTKIRDTTLSTQTANALVRNHIETIDELIQKTPEELFRFRLIGVTKITEIREFLSKQGLKLE